MNLTEEELARCSGGEPIFLIGSERHLSNRDLDPYEVSPMALVVTLRVDRAPFAEAEPIVRIGSPGGHAA